MIFSRVSVHMLGASILLLRVGCVLQSATGPTELPLWMVIDTACRHGINYDSLDH